MKDVYEEAERIADEIMKKANEKYPKEWPFLNDGEFEDATKGIIEMPDNTKCILSCHGGCCPTSTCSFSAKDVYICGIYKFRPAGCRIFFCDGLENNNWTVYHILPSKLEKCFCKDLPAEYEKRANCVKSSFINNEISSKEAKQEWKNIIQEYRNRKV
jgi:hypothetical protein